jgi:hypothetical protein
MPFESVLIFVYAGALALAVVSFLTLLRQIGVRTLSEANKSVVRFNARITSYFMLFGVFLLCFASGAIVCHHLLLTSALPKPSLLTIRAASQFGATVSCIFLHIHIMLMLKQAQGRKIVDATPAAQILACTLAASLALVCWSVLVLSNTHPQEFLSWDVRMTLPSFAAILLFIWSLLTTFLLGERGISDFKEFAARVKKRLTPPTPIEVQRRQRAQRMNAMNLPMAPRRRAAG